ncbi:3453_t:CDS:2 [Dentiscutata erythropus]|uniref:3453_t:CDS:1 n=1 Tax=Dentiscutata erythropus TaxID=1348616 RepID=A0A9N9DU15_9GLOM|nr:3453_t:CDS:2 [Dentiscutata erythropus]
MNIDSSHDEILHTTINDLIEKWKLGSTLLVDTKKCETIIEISNKKKNICFSKAVAADGLGAGVSQHAVQSFLATIGITSQCSKTIYHNHQHHLFSKIIELAKSSTNDAIIKCIKHVEQSLTEQVNNPTKLELYENKKILPISFDVS